MPEIREQGVNNVKFLVRFVLVSILLILTLTGHGATQTVQTSIQNTTNNSEPNVNQSLDKTALLSSMNLNTSAFKNMGDLAFVWQGLLWVLDGKSGEVNQITNSGEVNGYGWGADYLDREKPGNH